MFPRVDNTEIARLLNGKRVKTKFEFDADVGEKDSFCSGTNYDTPGDLYRRNLFLEDKC
jgi:hypothetical protein